jgi:hypothetical protein
MRKVGRRRYILAWIGRCEAGGGKKGGVDGDEILADCQEDFDADFSNDDGDLECDEGTRVQANIRTEI